mmetsp:Transcript_6171/g.14334  ORF Transcript_6171/g.14334 Transcript_6171/m.14334 type:complete len:88 (+) Transcript_6171:39-302(+)
MFRPSLRRRNTPFGGAERGRYHIRLGLKVPKMHAATTVAATTRTTNTTRNGNKQIKTTKGMETGKAVPSEQDRQGVPKKGNRAIWSG